jgi:hypothetical protein
MLVHQPFGDQGKPQDRPEPGVFRVMGDNADDKDGPSLAVYESVRCLACDTVYAKPTRGGTAAANPGCPECGYVGWVSVNVRLQGQPQRRFDEGPPLGRSAQSR